MQDQRTPSGLQASYLVCQSDEKLAQLLHFLKVKAAESQYTHLLLCCCRLSAPYSCPDSAPAFPEGQVANLTDPSASCVAANALHLFPRVGFDHMASHNE